MHITGKGEIIAGGNHIKKFKDVERIVDTYGGKKQDWVKKTSPPYYARDGRIFETHWVENIKSGQTVEFKTKFIK